jgi:hypothetical protein
VNLAITTVENRQFAGKAARPIYHLPFMREGPTKSGCEGGIVLLQQRGCDQRLGHSEIDGSEGFEAIYSVLGKARTVTEFRREHSSDLQRQIHPSTSMAVPVLIG